MKNLSAGNNYCFKLIQTEQHVVCRTTDRSIHSVKSASHRKAEQKVEKMSTLSLSTKLNQYCCYQCNLQLSIVNYSALVD